MKSWVTGRLFRKIFVSFLIVALVPLCLVYFYINSRYSRKLEQDALNMNRLAERNTGKQLEDFLIKTEYISNLFFNGSMQEILKGPEDLLSLYNARKALEKEVRVNLDLYKIMENVEQVTFVKKNGISYNIVNSISPGETAEFSGLGDVTVNTYKNHVLLNHAMMEQIPEGKMAYVRRINDVNVVDRELGYLIIVFRQEKIDGIFRDLEQVLETRVTVENQKGQIFYANFPDPDQWLKSENIERSGKASWMNMKYKIENFGLTVTFYDKTEKINANVRELIGLTEMMIGITVAIILIASLVFAKTIVAPVIRLRNNLVSVRSGNFKVRVPVDTKDELGEVGLAFNEMASEIDRLVNQVYTIRIKEKETAIAALQAQINPHFLYNTLDMIKSMAEIHGAYEVGDVIVALSGVFRYATHTDHFMVTIRDELANLDNYMKIVNARFGGKIVYTAQVPEELLGEQIVKVCLQPLVENAISHGLGRGGKGREIHVSFGKQDGNIVIRVKDDGVGMTWERLLEIRERLSFLPGENADTRAGSVGLKNIHDRIRLYYGYEYGVSIESAEGIGTVVTVRYPSDVRIGGKNESGENKDGKQTEYSIHHDR